MGEEHLRHVYGPVPSRRLGLSLGVDVVPLKTCTLDCLYCQLGPTHRPTVERRPHVPVEEALGEVAAALRERPTPDFVTVSGSGEPTLHRGLGDLIDGLRGLTRIPIAVITNGTLLWLPEVRAACAKADLVLPSLDAGDPETFRRVNRPHREVTFEKLLSGLKALRAEYQGQIWLEVFIVRGITDNEEAVRHIARLTAEVRPDRVQLNTAVRPPAQSDLRPVAAERMAVLASLFDPPAEVVADYRGPHAKAHGAGAQVVLEMLTRRPATVEDLSAGLGLRPDEVVRLVEELQRIGAVTREVTAGRRYYRPARESGDH